MYEIRDIHLKLNQDYAAFIDMYVLLLQMQLTRDKLNYVWLWSLHSAKDQSTCFSACFSSYNIYHRVMAEGVWGLWDGTI